MALIRFTVAFLKRRPDTPLSIGSLTDADLHICYTGTAPLAEGAISCMESIACSPCDGSQAAFTQFPLAGILGSAQARQCVDSEAIAICRQVTHLPFELETEELAHESP